MSYERKPAAGAEPKTIVFFYNFENLFNINSMWSMYKAVHKINEGGENLVDTYAITEDERDIFTSILSDATYDVFTRLLKYTKGISNAILFNEDYAPDGSVGTVAQKDLVTVGGGEGAGTIACAGIVKNIVWSSGQTAPQVAAAFVAANASDFALAGVTLSANTADIFFTAAVPGVAFSSPVTTVANGAITLNTASIAENVSIEKYVVVKIVDNAAYNINYIRPVDKVLEKCLRFYVLRDWFLLKDMDPDAAKADISYKQNINLLLRHSMQLKKALVTL